MRRNWIKLYVDQCLRGTMMSELNAEARWVWIGLLLMAGDSNVEGVVFLRKGEDGKLIGYSDQTLSEILAVDVSVFQLAKRKMKKYKKIAFDTQNVIKILSWNKYQSEYSRQKKYRPTEESNKENCNSGCKESNSLDIDRDKDRDKDSRNKEFATCDIELTDLLIEGIKTNDPKAKTPLKDSPEYEKWVNQVRLCRESDKRSEDEIKAMIIFSQNDEFWSGNILSATKLRKQIPQLLHKSRRQVEPKASQVGGDVTRERTKRAYERQMQQENGSGKCPNDGSIGLKGESCHRCGEVI